jgi:hypothetical protein
MLDTLGAAGLLGLVVLLAGVGVIASQNLVIAGGLALVVAGLGFVVYGLIRNVLSSMGLGGAM